MNNQLAKKLLLVLVFWLTPLLVYAESLAIIVNNHNQVESLDYSTVASMYRGEELRWPSGGRIKLVNREISSLVRKKFYKEVLNAKSGKKFYRAGTPVAIHSFIQRSDEAVVRLVASIKGAIGYVRLSHVTDSVTIVLVVVDK